MRILIVSQYFWPEKFRINDLAVGLKEKGHEVEVLTGKPNYGKTTFYEGYSFLNKSRETWNDIKIHRAALIPRHKANNIDLVFNYLSFALFGSIKAFFLKGRYDKIFVFVPSPIISGVPAIVLKRRKKIPIYFWVQDLWPESVTATTDIKNKRIINFLESVTHWIYKNCDKILIQSQAFTPSILQRANDEKKIIYYPNSVEALYKVVSPLGEFKRQLPQGFTVMFAGNIGEAQDFNTLLNAACITRDHNKNIKWVIIGDGRKKPYVEQKIADNNLQDVFFLLGERPVEQMPNFFACADCLLVSLKSNYIFSLTIPSKVQSYLACGKPLIGALDGEGARIIKDANAGLVSDAEDSVGLANNIEKMSKMSVSERAKLGNNARAYFELEFEREKLLDKLEDIFKSDL
ncbi:glycosyltransferase family 4 protein [Mucilaginibacter sp. RS28]|uniref:Glycosyltransferase family 4 protein n=1 Tax=Mucilaginibacter straminoryzae TaxID=2932774 RepID=A0A9X2BBS5_9SPHI|nr:glycosyltransferase family 4 protein [Mucilaginibacter straminoryzae]MCJ8208578.1 glycosyltransferase family 4 protein [Mucilaginibacter straminoryzae]